MYTYHHLAQRFCEVIRQSNGVAVPDQLRSVFELFAVKVMWLGFQQMGRRLAEARPRPVGWVVDSNKVCEVCNWEGKTLRAKYPRLACQRLERFCQAEKQKTEKIQVLSRLNRNSQRFCQAESKSQKNHVSRLVECLH